MARMVSAVLLVAVSGLLHPVFAGVTFIDPIPYLSAADSPFDMSGLGSTFFLEDFEDGDWDLPEGVEAYSYSIGNPGPTTDSVDADDGVVDGLGVDGHSMKPTFRYQNFLGPPTRYTAFQVNFDPQQLGYAPNTFGFVWTDGVPGSRTAIGVFDQQNLSIESFAYTVEMDPQHAGNSRFDRFLGFYSDVPFYRVAVINSYSDWIPMNHFEVDHVQFGVQIAEPLGAFGAQFSWLLCLLATALAAGRKLSKTRTETQDGHQKPRQVRKRGGGGAICLSRLLNSDSHALLVFTG